MLVHEKRWHPLLRILGEKPSSGCLTTNQALMAKGVCGPYKHSRIIYTALRFGIKQMKRSGISLWQQLPIDFKTILRGSCEGDF